MHRTYIRVTLACVTAPRGDPPLVIVVVTLLLFLFACHIILGRTFLAHSDCEAPTERATVPGAAALPVGACRDLDVPETSVAFEIYL